MQTTAKAQKGAEKILIALAEFDYLTAEQLTRLLYAPSSLSFVRKKLKTLRTGRFVLAIPRRSITLPLVYTLSSTGYTYTAALGLQNGRRVRPVDERGKAANPLFLEHSLAVSDVLIAAKLLSRTERGIVLTRMYTERDLKRKIYVEIPKRICIEPDASCEFTIHGEWGDFFFIEVYRNLPPVEWRFKQKIHSYVISALTGQHEALFHTPALSIAVLAQTPERAETQGMVATLKRWTEETLTDIGQLEQGGRFFFTSIDPATASPEDLFLSPVWEQAFSADKTPLLMLE